MRTLLFLALCFSSRGLAFFPRQRGQPARTARMQATTAADRSAAEAAAAVFWAATVLGGSVVVPWSLPSPAWAASGAVAKQEFFKAEDTASVGAQIYDEGERTAVASKLSAVETKWRSMMEKVNTYAATGFNRADRMEIKSALSLLMGDLKADMRLVSKVACGGDILVRSGAGSEAKFDYNSGKFAYKPVAQGAENVIDQVNEVYFNYVQAEPAVLDRELAKANALFVEWAGDVGKVLRK